MLSYRSVMKPDHLGVPIKGTMMRQPALMFIRPDDLPEKWKSICTSADENADAPILNKHLMASISLKIYNIFYTFSAADKIIRTSQTIISRSARKISQSRGISPCSLQI